MSTMTAADIADHNAILADLTAHDRIPRLTWEQHGAAFSVPPPVLFALEAKVVGVDSATPGTIERFNVATGKYAVRYPDVSGLCEYSARQLRPWPLA